MEPRGEEEGHGTPANRKRDKGDGIHQEREEREKERERREREGERGREREWLQTDNSQSHSLVDGVDALSQ